VKNKGRPVGLVEGLHVVFLDEDAPAHPDCDLEELALEGGVLIGNFHELVGHSVPLVEGDGVEEQRLMIEDVLDWRGGPWLVGATGVLVGIIGLLEFYHVVRRLYVPRLNMQRLSRTGQRLVHGLAWYGHFSRGTILLIMSYFLVLGAIHADPEEVVNTDKAFNFIGESLLGHPLFVIVAIGTVAYGVFMILQGIYLKWEKDRRAHRSFPIAYFAAAVSERAGVLPVDFPSNACTICVSASINWRWLSIRVCCSCTALTSGTTNSA